MSKLFYNSNPNVLHSYTKHYHFIQKTVDTFQWHQHFIQSSKHGWAFTPTKKGAIIFHQIFITVSNTSLFPFSFPYHLNTYILVFKTGLYISSCDTVLIRSIYHHIIFDFFQESKALFSVTVQKIFLSSCFPLYFVKL